MVELTIRDQGVSDGCDGKRGRKIPPMLTFAAIARDVDIVGVGVAVLVLVVVLRLCAILPPIISCK